MTLLWGLALTVALSGQAPDTSERDEAAVKNLGVRRMWRTVVAVRTPDGWRVPAIRTVLLAR